MALLAVGSVGSLAANVAVAEPTAVGRVITPWPSFALIGSYELLMRQVRHAASGTRSWKQRPEPRANESAGYEAADHGQSPQRKRTGQRPHRSGGRDLQRQAWQWAVAYRGEDGVLPSGKAIAEEYGRHERWGRLVKRAGLAGQLSDDHLRGA